MVHYQAYGELQDILNSPISVSADRNSAAAVGWEGRDEGAYNPVTNPSAIQPGSLLDKTERVKSEPSR
ncbi:hypothetical protein CCH79_00014292 [Gambusia affinis]|uniref:Uncharacterized protein n=1 Tax=Gambusia affinis TaxID=33528 RepID=A0A315UUP7_GAMAF|nr:hypothetical protein CCH79_00014292 [Gambusia affinis]